MTTPVAPRPELLALLRHAAENPDDVAARLVIADWLEEHGDEADRQRAEFVRLECRLSSHPETDPGGERRKQTIEQHAAAWLGPLTEAARWYAFRLGMVRLDLKAASFLQPAVQALASTETWAWVEQLDLTTTAKLAGQVAASPLLGLTPTLGR